MSPKCAKSRSNWRANNRDKCAGYQRSYYHRNKERFKTKRREEHLKTTYGLTSIQWTEMFEAQDNKCLICQTTEPAGKGWHTDHDHKTGVVRGILCQQCNIGLGAFKDNPKLLITASEYLRR